MKKVVVITGLFILLSGIAILLLGCPPPPFVKVRPPESRVEVHGPPPYPDSVWIPGHWKHRRGEWIWSPGRWTRPPRPHAVWVPGHWEPRGGGWAWVPGHWEYR